MKIVSDFSKKKKRKEQESNQKSKAELSEIAASWKSSEFKALLNHEALKAWTCLVFIYLFTFSVEPVSIRLPLGLSYPPITMITRRHSRVWQHGGWYEEANKSWRETVLSARRAGWTTGERRSAIWVGVWTHQSHSGSGERRLETEPSCCFRLNRHTPSRKGWCSACLANGEPSRLICL